MVKDLSEFTLVFRPFLFISFWVSRWLLVLLAYLNFISSTCTVNNITPSILVLVVYRIL